MRRTRQESSSLQYHNLPQGPSQHLHPPRLPHHNRSNFSIPTVLDNLPALTMSSISLTTATAVIDFNNIAIHLGRYLQSVITFLQLPTDVAWRRTVSAVQAANTATFVAISLYVQCLTNLVLQSISNSWNAIISSVLAAKTAVSTAVINFFSAIFNSVRTTISLAVDYIFGAVTTTVKATTGLFVDYLPTIALRYYSNMRRGITENINVNVVLFLSSLVWFYLRRCVFNQAGKGDVRATGAEKWRRRFNVAIRELAGVLVLGLVLSCAGYVTLPDWASGISSSPYFKLSLERATSLFLMIAKRLEPVYAGGGEILKAGVGKFANYCYARMPDWHWQFQFIPPDLGRGVGAVLNRITSTVLKSPIISGPPPPIIANLTSTVMNRLPPSLLDTSFTLGGGQMMPLLTGVIALWDIILLFRRHNRDKGKTDPQTSPFKSRSQTAGGVMNDIVGVLEKHGFSQEPSSYVLWLRERRKGVTETEERVTGVNSDTGLGKMG
ncbi:hypothetical protein QBC43DRAFT_309367 [Cladorrhinum sp. PSN259]|nr:hypothetical protein QBC43DRAFT_309367 [Cladorrhinum sp. PSN259]